MKYHNITWSMILCILSLPFSVPVASGQNKNNDELPIGNTAEGQKLEYQSLKSENQRIYRVRLTAMELKTEVNWKDKDETLFKANFPKCKNQNEPCSWVTMKIATVKMKMGKTLFGYGVNGDQFVVNPDAFRRDTENEPVSYPDLISGIEGTVSDREGSPVLLDVSVLSKVMQGKGKFKPKLVYEINVANSKATPLALSREFNPKKHPVVVWESADSVEFSKAIKENKFIDVNASGKVSVDFLADQFRVEHKLLKVMIGSEVIAATTAPAFRPKTLYEQRDQDGKPRRE